MKQVLNNIKLLAIFALVFSFVGCEDDDETPLPEVAAGFTFETVQGSGTVSFINISENADSFEWDFGNGQTSEEINPTVTYPTGTYTVTLTASNVAGASDTFEDELVIVIPEGIMVPVTFDDNNVNYDTTAFSGAAFEIVDNPDVSGTNNKESKVGAITNSGAAFEGFFFNLGTPIDFTENKKVQKIQMNFGLKQQSIYC